MYSKYAFISYLIVSEGFKRQGYGTLIMAELERLLIADGLDSIELCVFKHNLAACKLYEKLGYTYTTVENADLNRLYMEKQL
jgi:ribosomal protein S18 acetylase RimI-like enzyme